MSCNCHNHKEHSHTHSTNKDIKSEITIKLIGVLFFCAGFIIKSYSLYMFLMSYILFGYDVVFSAISNISKKNFFDETFLMLVASLGAFIIGDYPEAVAVMFFYSLGEFFQNKAITSSKNKISSLMALKQEYATLKCGTIVKPEELKLKDIIIVKPGEKFPTDGKIINGSGYVDTSSITGEPLPRFIKDEDYVSGGFISKDTAFTVEVTEEYKNSAIARILDIIENSDINKANTETFITRFSKIYTPVVIIMALLISVIPPFFTGFKSLSSWVYRGLTFLIVSCPCALVLSVPLSFYAAIGRCSHNGILVKGGKFISSLANTKAVVFDKTGTLTNGIISVKKIVTNNPDFKKLIYYSEYNSTHPLAQAVRKEFCNSFEAPYIESFEEIAGMGTHTVISGYDLYSGSAEYLNSNGIDIKDDSSNGTVIHLGCNGKHIGYIEFEDKIRYEAKDVLKALKKRRIITYMLTGDNKCSAKTTAETLDIKNYYYSLLPHNKAEKTNEIINKTKGNVVFIGDGINDAVALKTADIGISMGNLGSDIAVEASDVVIIKNSLTPLISAIDISKRTKRIITQNIIFILAVKFAVLLLTTLGFTFMWMAVVADVGTALIAILNIIRS